MKSSEKKKLAQYLTLIGSLLKHEIDELQIKGWIHYMRDYPFQFVLEVLEQWPRDNKWFPMPSEIIDEIECKISKQRELEREAREHAELIENFLSTYLLIKLRLKVVAIEDMRIRFSAENKIISEYNNWAVKSAAKLVSYGFKPDDAMVIVQNIGVKEYFRLLEAIRENPSEKIINIRQRRLRMLRLQAKQLTGN